MKRFEVAVPDGTMRLYYNSQEECQAMWPDALSISECKDESFKEIVKELKKAATNIVTTNSGEELWFYSLPIGEICYQQYKHEGEYIDGCKYRISSEFKLMMSSLWELSHPERFMLMFKRELERKKAFSLSQEEAIKLKLKKAMPDFEWYRIYRDGNGDFYIAAKSRLPSKAQVEEYDAHAGTEHIYVRYGRTCDWEYEWFNSIEEFNTFFKEYVANENPSFATPIYSVIATGKTLKDPTKRKCFFYVGKPPICYENDEKNARGWAFACRGILGDWRGFTSLFKYMIEMA